ncbi:hypothetical protein L1987_56130 [Smallanthus sonchifolius]|uniref:Uncharacterized protein n=1 Tax=Smallanthus sonchifolius TaxID=185202 RepID=A0ACB9EC83_9ASTR|nr:hypothetical protein L1987_56130 [Smallanthus sonchifolius]
MWDDAPKYLGGHPVIRGTLPHSSCFGAREWVWNRLCFLHEKDPTFEMKEESGCNDDKSCFTLPKTQKTESYQKGFVKTDFAIVMMPSRI